ncbi:hypothetical protein RCF13_21815, partial [Stenotrophomonas maltophilia group sp. RNC7]|nr:hypothetical protein [Stenotrophomonas maltophilia group sp. RNC7]
MEIGAANIRGVLTADQITTNISEVSSTLYVGGTQYNGTIILGSSFTRGSIDFNGESIFLNAMSGVYARSGIQDGLIITDNILDSYLEDYTRPYYRSNFCYV